MQTTTPDRAGGTDPAQPQCFVRFLRQRDSGHVEFVFSIGDPALGVELIMPRAAYDEFCAANRVHFMTGLQLAALDRDATKWRFGLPGIYE